MVKYTRLNEFHFGIAWGILAGICVLFTTIIGMINPGSAYSSLALPWLRAVYSSLGYNVSYTGIFLGAIYGFVDIFIISYLFALIYNKLNEKVR